MGTIFYSVIIVVFLNCLNAGIISVPKKDDVFELSVVHFNDFHARFEETDDKGGTCKTSTGCIGGFSRLYKQIINLINEKPKSILLNAGDNFQGTLWYTVGKWNITQEFMNKLPIDAEVLGNHEFDDGIAGVVPYIKALQHPIVVSNIDDSFEPDIQGTYKKSTVVERDGKRIGIIGVTTSDLPKLSSIGKLGILDESSSVNAEAERLVAEENVYTIIVLSHCGYDHDQIIAKNASEKISLIVGGHSHSFLYTGDNPPGPDTPVGPYPTIVESVHGHKVIITQASAYSKYLGNITIYLGDDGNLVDYSGAPIFLSAALPQDPIINEDLKPWKQKVDEKGNVLLGTSLVTLTNADCYISECLLGNFITDAAVFAYTKQRQEGTWTDVAIGLMNAGSLRTPINEGNITFADLISSQPFGNTIDFGQIQGKHLRKVLELGTTKYSTGRVSSSLNILQVSGLRIKFDLSKPADSTIVSLEVRCQNCTIPKYEPFDDDKIYNIAVNSFLAGGGDGFSVLEQHLFNKKIGRLDVDVYEDYITQRSPIFEEEGRIIVDNGDIPLYHFAY